VTCNISSDGGFLQNIESTKFKRMRVNFPSKTNTVRCKAVS
jgi:hypothetical protein